MSTYSSLSGLKSSLTSSDHAQPIDVDWDEEFVKLMYTCNDQLMSLLLDLANDDKDRIVMHIAGMIDAQVHQEPPRWEYLALAPFVDSNLWNEISFITDSWLE